jgi:uncharacterized membrane protein
MILDATLIVTSVAFPLAGLVGVRSKAARDARALAETAKPWDPEHSSQLGEWDILSGALRAMVANGPAIASRDLLLIGGGVALAGIAGIWALWL